jgi:glycosyltransferase involved in cell wall biosynthesis
MKILQVHKFLAPRDGASNYMLQLSGLLEAAGHEVIPFATKHKGVLDTPYTSYFPPYIDLRDPSNHSFSTKVKAVKTMWWSGEARRSMARLLDEHPVDVAHLHNIYHHLSPSILPELAKRRIPIVMTVHDYNLLSPNYSLFHHGRIHEEEAKGLHLSAIAHKSIQNSYLQSAVCVAELLLHNKLLMVYKRYIDRLICPSQFAYDLFARLGWSKDVLLHVPHPVSFPLVPVKTYDNVGPVTYMGRLSEEKGLWYLLEAAALLPEIPFALYGDGPLRTKLEARVKELELHNVRFPGFVTGAAVEEALVKASVLVLPSVWYENYPLAILEAKALGKIMIGSAIGGIPELLPAELAVPPGNAKALAERIHEWYTKPEQDRLAMGKKLQSQVYSVNDPAHHVAQIMALYESLV